MGRGREREIRVLYAGQLKGVLQTASDLPRNDIHYLQPGSDRMNINGTTHLNKGRRGESDQTEDDEKAA